MSDFANSVRQGWMASGGGRGYHEPRARATDRTQLEEHPVELRRILRLFTAHRGAIALVMLLLVASSLIGLAQPFLVRAIIDRALPQQNHAQLIGAVAAM